MDVFIKWGKNENSLEKLRAILYKCRLWENVPLPPFQIKKRANQTVSPLSMTYLLKTLNKLIF